MRTLIVIVIGLVLARAVIFGVNLVNKGRSAPAINGSYWFIGLWLAFCLVDFYIGVFKAGYSAKDELVIHLVVFGIPALAAWFLPRLISN
jgi:hypothetical protein